MLERLKLDFAGGRIFRTDPVVPRELEIFWDFDCVMRGETEKHVKQSARWMPLTAL